MLRGRCEDKKTGKEQKVNVANKEAHMCLGDTGRELLSSQINGNCVFCHIRFDARPVCDWSCPLLLTGVDSQATDAVLMNAGLSFSGWYKWGRGGRGGIEASSCQCNEIKPDQPELPVFYWTLFQFPFCFSICIRKILKVAASAH